MTTLEPTKTFLYRGHTIQEYREFTISTNYLRTNKVHIGYRYKVKADNSDNRPVDSADKAIAKYTEYIANSLVVTEEKFNDWSDLQL